MRQPVPLLLENETGSVLLVAMLILIVLTLIGIAATNTSTIEIQIAGNEKSYKQAFYSADAGVSWALVSLIEWDVDPSSVVPDTRIPNEGENKDMYGNRFQEVPAGGPVPAGSVFDLYYLRPIADGPPKEIEIESSCSGGQANVSIIAGIELPQTGGGQGTRGQYEGTY